MTRVALGTRRKRRGSISHKLTGSSFVTQRVYKRATACHCYWYIRGHEAPHHHHHCYWLAEHICEQRQGSYWRGQRIKNLSCWSGCSVSEQRQRPNCHHWRASPASSGTRTKTWKGFTILSRVKVCAPKTRPDQNRNNMSHSLYNHPYALNHIQLVKWTFHNYEVNIFKMLAMIYHRFHVAT